MAIKADTKYENTSLSNEEGIINFDEIITICLKNKKFIILMTIVGAFISAIVALGQKNIWAGQFQILVRKEASFFRNNNSMSESATSNLNILSSLNGTNDKLSTEIEILKSPSVLTPVFDFVKQSKKSKGVNASGLKYSSWLKDNLKVELVKGTDVLDLTYKDVDKEIIMPTLKMISKTYQAYSGRNRSEGIDKGLKYLNNQIKKYEDLSSKSLRESSIHAQENDLIPPSALSLSTNIQYKDRFFNNNVEAMRILASNEVRTLKRQLKELENSPKNDKTAPYILAKKLDSEMPILKKINTIDNEITTLETYFKNDDEDLKRLKQERTNLEVLLKEYISNSLKGELKLAQAKLEASKRPTNVLVKYDTLLRKLFLNYETLEKLNTDKRRLSLEKARNEDPWELISNPTVYDFPVSPDRSQIVLLGTMISLFIAISLISIIYKIKGITFSRKEIEDILDISVLQDFTDLSFKNIKENLILLSKSLNFSEENNSIAFLVIGNIDQKYINEFKKIANTTLTKDKIVFTNNFLDSLNFDKQFLITKKGGVTKKELLEVKQKLLLQKNLISGLFLIEDKKIYDENNFYKILKKIKFFNLKN